MSADQLYQQLILDYSKLPNKRDLPGATHFERGHNPSCGDDLTLIVSLEDDVIADASFVGNGCAISSASTNMLIELIRGKKVEEVKRISNAFFQMMNEKCVSEEAQEVLEDAVILEMTANMPARIKCATLSWHSLKVILDQL